MDVHIKIKHPGSLTKYGYHLDKDVKARREALDKALSAYGKTDLIHKLTALKTFNKHTKYKSKVDRDLKYVEQK